jgi:hypothetical protein
MHAVALFSCVPRSAMVDEAGRHVAALFPVHVPDSGAAGRSAGAVEGGIVFEAASQPARTRLRGWSCGCAEAVLARRMGRSAASGWADRNSL